MAKIVDKILYSLDEAVPEIQTNDGRSVVDIILDFTEKELEASGDRILIREAENEAFKSQIKHQQRLLSQFREETVKIANALIANGLEKGDVVQMAMHNNSDYLFPVVATWMSGGAVSLSDPSLTPKVMKQQLNAIKAKFVFCTGDVIENVVEASENLDYEIKNIIVVNHESDGKYPNPKVCNVEHFTSAMSGTCVPNVHKRADLKDLAVIFWSSGTTGNPKGIKNNHGALIRNLTNHVFSPDSESKCFLQTTCMFHAGGFLFSVINAICFGIRLITFSLRYQVSANAIFEACDKYKPSVLMLGSHHGFVLSSESPRQGLDLTSVVSIVPVGAPLHVSLPDELRKKFTNARNIVNAYGMSEASGISKGNSFNNLGKIVRGVQVKIVHPDSGQLLGPEQVGEICVKTEGLMDGYINVSETEAKAAFDEDGYFKSGDLGWYDAQGQLYYKERLKALIKYLNYHIYPAEIENIIQNLDGVAEVGVFGLPDPKVQELISAAVVPKPGFNLTEQEIILHVNEQVEEFKKIRGGVYLVDHLPRSLQGKILRRNLHGFLKPRIASLNK